MATQSVGFAVELHRNSWGLATRCFCQLDNAQRTSIVCPTTTSDARRVRTTWGKNLN
jgi:hypothetical protein